MIESLDHLQQPLALENLSQETQWLKKITAVTKSGSPLVAVKDHGPQKGCCWSFMSKLVRKFPLLQMLVISRHVLFYLFSAFIPWGVSVVQGKASTSLLILAIFRNTQFFL